MSDISFRQFIREYEEVEPGFTQGVKYNLGIDPADQAKNPQPLGNAQFGDKVVGTGTYEIVKYLYNHKGEPTKALVRIMDTSPYSVYGKAPDGKGVMTPNKPKFRTMLIDVNGKGGLDSLRTQEVPQDGQGAGDAGQSPIGGGNEIQGMA